MMSFASTRWILWSTLAATTLLAGCAGTRCCYVGETALLDVAQTEVVLADGRTTTFDELVPEYEPVGGIFSPFFPVFRLDIERVVFPHLRKVLDEYDANGNEFIEEPELTVLYMVEAARGLGHEVRQVGQGRPIKAIYTGSESVGGLVRLAKAHRPSMSLIAQKTFDELDLLRIKFRLDGTEPGEQGDGFGS